MLAAFEFPHFAKRVCSLIGSIFPPPKLLLKTKYILCRYIMQIFLPEVIYMRQVVLPIKDSNVLKEVQDTLLNNFKA
ncbi:site-specific integrase, partial [Pediococcus acidilactici]|nr:site-specific integrase [Pediococcus acidilactici]